MVQSGAQCIVEFDPTVFESGAHVAEIRQAWSAPKHTFGHQDAFAPRQARSSWSVTPLACGFAVRPPWSFRPQVVRFWACPSARRLPPSWGLVHLRMWPFELCRRDLTPTIAQSAESVLEKKQQRPRISPNASQIWLVEGGAHLGPAPRRGTCGPRGPREGPKVEARAETSLRNGVSVCDVGPVAAGCGRDESVTRKLRTTCSPQGRYSRRIRRAQRPKVVGKALRELRCGSKSAKLSQSLGKFAGSRTQLAKCGPNLADVGHKSAVANSWPFVWPLVGSMWAKCYGQSCAVNLAQGSTNVDYSEARQVCRTCFSWTRGEQLVRNFQLNSLSHNRPLQGRRHPIIPGPQKHIGISKTKLCQAMSRQTRSGPARLRQARSRQVSLDMAKLYQARHLARSSSARLGSGRPS